MKNIGHDSIDDDYSKRQNNQDWEEVVRISSQNLDISGGVHDAMDALIVATRQQDSGDDRTHASNPPVDKATETCVDGEFAQLRLISWIPGDGGRREKMCGNFDHCGGVGCGGYGTCVSWRSHPLCPPQPKSVTSDHWRQVWPLHDAFSVNQNWQQVDTAADWISCSLPGLRWSFRGVRGSWSFRFCGGLPRGVAVLGDRRPFRHFWELSCMAHPRKGVFCAGRQTRRLSLCRN